MQSPLGWKPPETHSLGIALLNYETLTEKGKSVEWISEGNGNYQAKKYNFVLEIIFFFLPFLRPATDFGDTETLKQDVEAYFNSNNQKSTFNHDFQTENGKDQLQKVQSALERIDKKEKINFNPVYKTAIATYDFKQKGNNND